MALAVTQDYDDPYKASTSLGQQTYARITAVRIDLLTNRAHIALSFWYDKAARDQNKQPINTSELVLTSQPQVIEPVTDPETGNVIIPGYVVPALQTVLGDPDIAAGFDTLRGGIYQALKAIHPLLQAASDV